MVIFFYKCIFHISKPTVPIGIKFTVYSRTCRERPPLLQTNSYMISLSRIYASIRLQLLQSYKLLIIMSHDHNLLLILNYNTSYKFLQIWPVVLEIWQIPILWPMLPFSLFIMFEHVSVDIRLTRFNKIAIQPWMIADGKKLWLIECLACSTLCVTRHIIVYSVL